MKRMLPLFAESVTPPPGFAVWLACAAFAVMLLNQGFKLVRNFKGERPQQLQQPIEVKHAHECVEREQFEKLEEENAKEHHNIFARVGGMERGLREEVKRDVNELRVERRHDVAELHKRLNTVESQNAAQTKAQELTNQRLVHMDGKLDRLIERNNNPNSRRG